MAKREYLIEESTKMFTSLGLKDVRMDDIAKKCGVSKRTIYEIFGGREELIKECAEFQLKSTLTKLAEFAQSAENVIDTFWIVFGESNVFRQKNIKLLGGMRKYYPKLFKEMMIKDHAAAIITIREGLEMGIKEGVISDNLDMNYCSTALANHIFGLTMSDINKIEEGTDYDQNAFRMAIIVFLRGMCTSKGIEYIDDKIEKIKK